MASPRLGGRPVLWPVRIALTAPSQLWRTGWVERHGGGGRMLQERHEPRNGGDGDGTSDERVVRDDVSAVSPVGRDRIRGVRGS